MERQTLKWNVQVKKPYSFDQAQKDALRNGPAPTLGKFHQASFDWVTAHMLGEPMKTLEEQLLGTESQAAVSRAVEAAVARADAAGLPPAYEPHFSMQRRREMVDQVNANQRLEGYEPDEQLRQLQERFIAGELETKEMLEILTDYALNIQAQPPTDV